jgi:hypothetical protein
MARAFHRVPPQVTNSSSTTTRLFSGSAVSRKWEGRQPEEHPTTETDKPNVQHEAVKDGKEERAKGEGSRGTSESSGGSNERAKEEFPEATDTIGMQDERGQNGK